METNRFSFGKDHKGALLTINDRATGLLFMGKIDSKEAKAVETKP
ncbi:hypothetical protein NPX36_03260 [Paenimyroides aestuarii]|uniref:Uncharacterized protein n=1 Tax=Paenimyroides aestuarii TaxID=2968490 RepID=A0ABY5NU42_9FLAO|nr:hypothetical protein [Paenimyroides aestuarii]UUV22076.1 hypothetical protein NPX36_03260 [Paenimyroides aestuarii]